MSRLKYLLLLLLLLGCVPATTPAGEPVAPTVDPVSATATAAAPDLPTVAVTEVQIDADASPTPPATPTPFPTPSATPILLPCEAPFAELRLSAETVVYAGLAQLEQNPQTNFPQLEQDDPTWDSLVLETVNAGTQYLNQCTDPTRPLADQAESLAQLATFYQLIPSLSVEIALQSTPPSTYAWESAQAYLPETELLDLDGDGEEELILHTQLPFYSAETVLTIQGGLTIAFYQHPDGWQGKVIWPFHYFVPQAEDYLRYAPFWESAHVPNTPTEALNVRPHPTLQQLEPGYLAIAGSIFSPLDDFLELGVIRWAAGEPELALDIFQANWCVTVGWDIASDGSITVPFLPEPFPHCAGEYNARHFQLLDGHYTMEELPPTPSSP